jgi:hypothetical protein
MVVSGIIIERGVLADGTRIDIDGVEIPSNDQRVLFNGDRDNWIGMADVSKQNGALVANIEFFKKNEAYMRLYPSVAVIVDHREEGVIHKCKLVGVNLSATHNQDTGIFKISDQIAVKIKKDSSTLDCNT